MNALAMKHEIQMLRERVEALASQARAMKCQAEEAGEQGAFELIEKAEDALDAAAHQLLQARREFL